MWPRQQYITSSKRLSMLFKIEQSSEKINRVGNMALVGVLLDKAEFNEAVNAIQTGK